MSDKAAAGVELADTEVDARTEALLRDLSNIGYHVNAKDWATAFDNGWLAAREHYTRPRSPAVDEDVRLDTVMQCLAFFKSVIQSGETWSSHCQYSYLETMRTIESLKTELARTPQGDDWAERAEHCKKCGKHEMDCEC